MIAQGIDGEEKGQNVAANALWPATVIRYATTNCGMGTPS